MIFDYFSWTSGSLDIKSLAAEHEYGRENGCAHEQVMASVVAHGETPPVLDSPEHPLYFLATV